jgi:hypothetical protein
MVKGAKSYKIINLGKYKIIKGVTVDVAGNILKFTGIAVSITDIAVNGANANNVADAVVGVATLIPGVGLAIGGVYFLANSAVKKITGKTIPEHAADAVKSVNDNLVQPVVNYWNSFGNWLGRVESGLRSATPF